MEGTELSCSDGAHPAKVGDRTIWASRSYSTLSYTSRLYCIQYELSIGGAPPLYHPGEKFWMPTSESLVAAGEEEGVKAGL